MIILPAQAIGLNSTSGMLLWYAVNTDDSYRINVTDNITADTWDIQVNITTVLIDGYVYNRQTITNLNPDHTYTVLIYNLTQQSTSVTNFYTNTTDSILPTPFLQGTQAVNGIVDRNKKIILTWWFSETPENPVNYYKIEYSVNIDFTDSEVIYVNKNKYIILTDLEPNTTYFVKMQSTSVNSDNNSQISNITEVTTSDSAEFIDYSCTESTLYVYGLQLPPYSGIGGTVYSNNVQTLSTTISNIASVIDKTCQPCTRYTYTVGFEELLDVRQTVGMSFCEGRVIDVLLTRGRGTFNIRLDGVLIKTLTSSAISEGSITDGSWSYIGSNYQIVISQLNTDNPIVYIDYQNNYPNNTTANESFNLNISYFNSSSGYYIGDSLGNHNTELMPVIIPEVTVLGSKLAYFSWESVEDIEKYQLNVSKNLDLSEPQSRLFDTNIALWDNLDPDTVYYAYVLPVKQYFKSETPVTAVIFKTKANLFNLTGEYKPNYIDITWENNSVDCDLYRDTAYNFITNIQLLNDTNEESYHDTLINYSTDYFYKLVQSDNPNNYDVVFINTGKNIPDTPTGLNVIDLPYKVYITWLPTDNISYYILERAVDNGSFSQIYSGTTLNYADTEVTLGTVYWYRVIAVGADGGSNPTEPSSGSPTINQVINVKSSLVNSRIQLTWDRVDKATYYVVYRSINGIDYNINQTVSITLATDSVVDFDTEYSYQVQAFYSPTIFGTKSDIVTAVAGLSIPTGFTATSGQSVKLTWDKHKTVNTFDIYYGNTIYGPFNKLTSVVGTEYIDTTGDELTTRYYYLTATHTIQNVSSQQTTTITGYFTEIIYYYYIGDTVGSFDNNLDWSAAPIGDLAIKAAPTIASNKIFVIQGIDTVSLYNLLTDSSHRPSFILDTNTTLTMDSDIYISNVKDNDYKLLINSSGYKSIKVNINEHTS